MLQFVWLPASKGFALYTVRSGYGATKREQGRFGFLGVIVGRLEVRFRAPWRRAPRWLTIARL
jgi:hypothetical protein